MAYMVASEAAVTAKSWSRGFESAIISLALRSKGRDSSTRAGSSSDIKDSVARVPRELMEQEEAKRVIAAVNASIFRMLLY